MAVSDPIADMLTRIRNASMAHHDSVQVPVSRMKLSNNQDTEAGRLYCKL